MGVSRGRYQCNILTHILCSCKCHDNENVTTAVVVALVVAAAAADCAAACEHAYRVYGASYYTIIYIRCYVLHSIPSRHSLTHSLQQRSQVNTLYIYTYRLAVIAVLANFVCSYSKLCA